jgi:16S rRNA (cytidine1402-2'-O)-methyltransferase
VLTIDGRHCDLAVEVARTRAARRRGLLGRDDFAGALVLSPCCQVHTFGMRFAIDVAFCSREGRVLHVRTMLPGRVSRPMGRARFVVETRAGGLLRRGVRRGSLIVVREHALVGREGALVLVATPIGNLGDLAPRAVEALRSADVIAAEDTRRTRALLTHAGVPGGRRLVAVHEHNERARAAELVERIRQGQRVAFVCDAGMPGISDPGERLVRVCVDAGVRVEVVPGPSAALAALVVSGLPTRRFVVEGFLPRSGRERAARLAELARESRTAVVFEAPNRVAATLTDLMAACGADRRVVVARELTKVHEEVWRGTLVEAALRAAEREPRGEHVLVLAPAAPADQPDDAVIADAVRARLAAGASVRDAAAEVAADLGVPKRRVYDIAVTLRRS